MTGPERNKQVTWLPKVADEPQRGDRFVANPAFRILLALLACVTDARQQGGEHRHTNPTGATRPGAH